MRAAWFSLELEPLVPVGLVHHVGQNHVGQKKGVQITVICQMRRIGDNPLGR